MDIQFFGANCIVITTKQVRLVFDDNLEQLGRKSIIKEGDVALYTSAHAPVQKAKMTIDLPGEYEVSGISIHGIQTRLHIDGDTERSAVMYKVTVGEVRVLITGHIYPKLSEARLEDVGIVDIMLAPVGGNGLTLDPTGALQVIKQVEPKLFVPTQYADDALTFEVPQTSLDDALKIIGLEPKESVKKLQFKPGEVTDTTQLVVLEKS